MKSKVAVLLSTYNGEKYLKEQIKSILNQKDVEITIFVRDDGSKDRTIGILHSYKQIKVFKEKNVGYAKSFWNLLSIVDKYDYYAFCDQDDIWEETKLISAIEKLKKEDNQIPLLYTSRVKSYSNDGTLISNNTFGNRVLNKYECFQKSIIPGCVFVFNNKALNLMKKYNGFMESHDWMTYIIVSVFGKVIYDDNSYIKYRIHDNNTIGKNSKWKNLLIRIKRFFSKSKHTRSLMAKDFYDTFKKELELVENKEDIYELGYYRSNLKTKIKLLFNKNYKGIIFKLYVLLNKI